MGVSNNKILCENLFRIHRRSTSLQPAYQSGWNWQGRDARSDFHQTSWQNVHYLQESRRQPSLLRRIPKWRGEVYESIPFGMYKSEFLEICSTLDTLCRAEKTKFGRMSQYPCLAQQKSFAWVIQIQSKTLKVGHFQLKTAKKF